MENLQHQRVNEWILTGLELIFLFSSSVVRKKILISSLFPDFKTTFHMSSLWCGQQYVFTASDINFLPLGQGHHF